MITSNSFRISLLGGLTLTLTLLSLTGSSTAQVLSDGDVGNPNVNSTLGTIVDTVADTSNISGGTRPGGGQNLFHSFSQFDVQVGHTALFQNSVGNPATANIFGRVTNGNPSNIFGTVDSATNFPTASLWLMNPAGFLFGPNATLNVAGTFAAVTANSLNFEDGTKFPSAPNTTTDGLLNVSNVVAMEFMGTDTPVMAAGSEAAIEVQGLDSQGADVLLVGRDAQSGVGGPFVPGVLINGETKTNGGDFTVGSADTVGLVGVNAFDPGEVNDLGGTIRVNHNDTNDTDGRVNVVHATDTSMGGRIVIRSGYFTMDGSNTVLQASVANGANPSIDIETTTSLTIQGGTISTGAKATHDAGSIRLVSGEITLANSRLSTQAGGTGAGGPISIEASAPNTLNIDNSIIVTTVNNVAGGNDPTNGLAPITLTSPTIDIKNGSIVWTNTIGSRNAGPITFNVQNLDINGSFIRSTSGAVSPDLGVVLDIADFFVFDLRAALVSPAGELIVLFQNVGGFGHNFAGTTFSDGADTLVSDGVAPFSGQFRPQQLFSTFTDGTLSPLVGQWGLIILDEFSGDPNGMLQQWSLTFGDMEVASPNVPRTIDNTIPTSTLTVNPNTGATGNIVVQGFDSLGIEAKEVNLSNSQVASLSFGDGQTGNISIHSDTVSLNNESEINSSTFGPGKGGDIEVLTDNLLLNNFSAIRSNSSTGSSGNTGNIIVKGFSDSHVKQTNLSNDSVITSVTNGSGKAGDITLHSEKVLLENGAQISTGTVGTGDGGNLKVDAQEVTITDIGALGFVSGFILNSQNPGAEANAGTLDLTATKSITLSQGGAISGFTAGAGRGSDFKINTGVLKLENGSRISVSTGGKGDGGNVTVTASESITISGILETNKPINDPLTQQGQRSGIFSTSQNLQGGNAGSIKIMTPGNVNVSNQGTLSTSTAGSGNGGDIEVSADQNISFTDAQVGAVSLVNGNAGNISITAGNTMTIQDTEITSESKGTGQGGTITLNAKGANTLTLDNTTVTAIVSDFDAAAGETADSGVANISITSPTINIDGTTITTQSEGTRNAGGVEINATNTLKLLGNSAVSAAADVAQAGDLSLDAKNLLFIQDSTVTSSVQGGSGTEGGDISIGVNSNPGFLILQNSSIATTALFGDGGDVNFNGQVRLIDPFTAIDVSSQFGTSGTVNESGPIQNLSGAIAPLPENIVDIATLVGQHCAAQNGGQLSSFVQAGRDVVPPGPTDFLTSPLFLEFPQPSTAQGSIRGVVNLASQQLGMASDGKLNSLVQLAKLVEGSERTKCVF